MIAAASSPIELNHDREAYYDRYRRAMARRYKSFDPLNMEVIFNLVQTFACGEAHLAAQVHSHGLTLASLNVMSILSQNEPDGCPLNTVSDLLLVSRANVTGLVDGLVRKGFVRRREDPADRRITRARITPKGRAWLESYLPKHYRGITELLSGLSRGEKQTLARLLSKLRHSSCAHPRGGAR